MTDENPPPAVDRAMSPSEQAALLATYQSLANRFIATRALAWQIPALSLAAQAFLISTTTQVSNEAVIEVLLAISILLIGIASGLLQLSIGQAAVLDMPLIDHYEVALLGKNSSFRTHYTATMAEREELFRAVVTARQWSGYLWIFNRIGRWPITRVNARAIWATMQIMVSVAGALIAILLIK